MKKDNTLWAQVLFALTILAAMLLPSRGRAQEIPNAQTLKNESDPVRRSMSVNGYTFGNVQTKKDTVVVRVLCESPVRPKCLGCNPEIEFRSIKQERTLEWQTWDSNTTQFAIYRPKSDWVVTERRWLEDTSGCYQLVPLE